MRYQRKSCQGFLSGTTRPVDSRYGRSDSPHDAHQVGESGVALGRPVPENSEITNTELLRLASNTPVQQ